jgi:hypothetical protein
MNASVTSMCFKSKALMYIYTIPVHLWVQGVSLVRAVTPCLSTYPYGDRSSGRQLPLMSLSSWFSGTRDNRSRVFSLMSSVPTNDTSSLRSKNSTTTSLGSQRSSKWSAFAESMGSVFSGVPFGRKGPGLRPPLDHKPTGKMEASPRKKFRGRSSEVSHITTGYIEPYHYKGTFTTTPTQTTLDFEWSRKDGPSTLAKSFKVVATSHDDLYNETYTQCNHHDLPTEMQECLLKDVEKHFE